jgi:NADPH:quinone reductase-like Zn-dependent oxidoreductase
MNAVRFDDYGDVDVLDVRDVDDPVADAEHAVVRVKATGINPGESTIRSGAMHDRFPATFPSGEGSDLAGVIEVAAGPWSVGDEVIGWSDARAAHAELVAVPVGQLVARPPEVPWEVGGALYVVGATAWAAVRAVGAGPGDTVVVSGAAGGVGTLTVQLAVRAGARVIGLASETNHEWLRSHGVEPMTYGDGLAERLPKPDAFIDLFGGGYVALAVQLGVARDRINTIIDWPAVEEFGVKSEGNYEGAKPEVMAELAGLIASGELELPIAATYPLADVRRAYRDLAARHTRGKRVLIP